MRIMKNILIFISMALIALSILSCGSEATVIYKAPTFQDAEDLAKLRAREKDELTSYKLLDSVQGVYQIPVDSAMKILSGSTTSK